MVTPLVALCIVLTVSLTIDSITAYCAVQCPHCITHKDSRQWWVHSFCFCCHACPGAVGRRRRWGGGGGGWGGGGGGRGGEEVLSLRSDGVALAVVILRMTLCVVHSVSFMKSMVALLTVLCSVEPVSLIKIVGKCKSLWWGKCKSLW